MAAPGCQGKFMFGYVVANTSELKVREYRKYKAYYCGLCGALREKYGFIGQMTLTYDMTFLVILLTSLYECATVTKKGRCAVHPVKRQTSITGEATGYAADMNVLMAYYKFADDRLDERKLKSTAGIRLTHPAFEKIKARYPEKCRVIAGQLAKLGACERQKETRPDIPSGYFGYLTAELFAYRHDVWEKTLRRMGFYLGKFIYIMDAYDDVDDDIKNGAYNVLAPIRDEPDFDIRVRDMMNDILGRCAAEFEKLPCVRDAEILRNILYAGVWTAYGKKRNARKAGRQDGGREFSRRG